MACTRACVSGWRQAAGLASGNASGPSFEKSAKRPVRLLMAQDGDGLCRHRRDGRGPLFLKNMASPSPPAARAPSTQMSLLLVGIGVEEALQLAGTDQPPPAGFPIWVTRRAEEGRTCRKSAYPAAHGCGPRQEYPFQGQARRRAATRVGRPRWWWKSDGRGSRRACYAADVMGSAGGGGQVAAEIWEEPRAAGCRSGRANPCSRGREPPRPA